MIIELIRHGAPDYTTDSLTERGVAEAEALGKYMKNQGLTHLYVSPLGRAQQTAAPVAAQTGLQAVTLPWTRELTGVYYEVPPFGRCAPFTLPAEVWYADAPRPVYEGWETQPYLNDPRVLPRIEEMRAGSDALLAAHGYRREGVLYRRENPAKGDHIAVVCHGGLGVTWLSHLLNLPMVAAWAGFYLASASITTIVMEDRGGEFVFPRMIRMGDVSPLRAAGLEDFLHGLHF